MNNLYEALEVCLQDIELGVDLETALFRFPALADELRPILEASIHAKGIAALAPAADVVRRNRAKFLQRAAELREAQAQPVLPFTWSASLRRVAVTLIVLGIVFASGTGLVRAASTTLPGDNLYPIKRTWEGVSLFFTFNNQQREALEIQHENERLEELNELLAEGRSEEVDFSGLVTRQEGDQWIVAGIQVVVSAQTEIRDQPILVGSAVRVRGITRGDGVVLAERIRLLSSDANVPDVREEPEIENENNEGPNQENENNSGPGSADESSQVDETQTPESDQSGSNSGSGSDSNSNDNTGIDSNNNDENGNDSNSNDENSNDSNSNDSGSDHSGSNDTSQNDNSNEDNSNDGGNSGSGSDSGGGGDNGG